MEHAMVAIFTGLGAGFERGSANVLGANGLWGSGAQGRAGDQVSVNAATGNLVISRQDEFLVGRGPDVGISRTYNNMLDIADNDNGDNWRQSTDRRVYDLTGTLNTAGSTVKRVGSDGAVVLYTYDTAAAAYVTSDGSGAYDRITKSGNDWIWRDGDSQTTEHYDALNNGRIRLRTDVDGNSLTFSYHASGLLDKFTTADGSWTQYSWSGNNITAIVTGYTDLATSTAKTLTRTHYVYDGSNRLTTVKVDRTPDDNSIADSAIYQVNYSYDGNGRIAQITQTDGSAIAFAYDGSGRVITVTQTVASGVTRVTGLAYYSNLTVITDPRGQTTQLHYDAQGQLLQMVAPANDAGLRQIMQYKYDVKGNVLEVIETNSARVTVSVPPSSTVNYDTTGRKTVYTYDASGNWLTRTDANSNVTTRTYGAKNELLSETRTGSDASGAAVSLTSRFVYDVENHLRYEISAAGQVTEYIYATNGQLQWVKDYPEHTYTIAGTPSEAAMNSWRDGLGDRSSLDVVNHLYDARGNRMSTIDYAYASSAGAASSAEGYARIYYVYDQAGQLLSSYRQGFASETYAYDGLGRMISSTNANGGSTTIVFADAANTTTVTTSDGLTSISSFNKAGELLSQVDSGSHVTSGTASYAYDGNGRLRVATDASGKTSFYLYDNAGRKTADIDEVGNVVEYRYDAAGRLAATALYTNLVSAANLTALANPNNTLTVAAIRPASNSQDLWSWTLYDLGGRVLQTIEGDGSVTSHAYDASNRLIATTGYANKLASATVNGFKTTLPTSLVTPTASSNDKVSRSFYDKDGRLIGALDGEGYLSEIIYDAAGRKVQEIGYAQKASGALGTATFNTLRTTVAPTSAANVRTYYVYDGRVLRYTIDAGRNVTGFTYDFAGNLTTTVQYATVLGATSDYSFDNIKAMVATDAADRKSWTVFNTLGQMANSIDAQNAVTAFSYDGFGRITKTVQYDNLRATTSLPTFSTMASWATATAQADDSANRIDRHWYNAAGERVYSVDAKGFVSRFVYDAAGRLVQQSIWPENISVDDTTTLASVASLAPSAGTAITTSYAYYESGQLHTVTDGEGNVTAYTYYGTGQTQSVFEAYGTVDQAETRYLYDGAGRVSTEYHAYGEPEQIAIQYAYDGLGNQTSITDARGKITSFAYDKRGLLIQTTDALSGVTAYQYNAFGEVVKVTDPRGNASYNYYDNLGRLTLSRDAEDYLTSTSYTTFGEIASVTRYYVKTVSTASTTILPSITTNAKDATTLFEYDKRGQVTKTTDAEGHFETFTYNAFGNRITAVAKSDTAAAVSGGTTIYAYDRRGQMVSETLPIESRNANGTLQATSVTNNFYYDARGNRTKMIEGFGLIEARTTIYQYDKNNRLTKTTGDTVSGLSINTASQAVTAVSGAPTARIEYDRRGNVIRTEDANGEDTLYFYDDLNRNVVTIDALGGYTRTSYDAGGNVTSVKRFATQLVTIPATGGDESAAPANPAGASRETLFTYDDLGRMLTSKIATVDVVTWNGSAHVLAAFDLVTSYVYDANGNVVKTTDPNGNVVWSYYDRMGRKTAQVDQQLYLTTWQYDTESNVLQEQRYSNKIGTQSALVPNASTTIAALIASSGTHADDRITLYSYDRNGHRLTEQRPNMAVLSGSGQTSIVTSTVSYAYNGLGQVIYKIEATGDTTLYDYDKGGRLIEEQRQAYMGYENVAVTPKVNYYYNGLNDLARTVQAGAGSTAARVTTYAYGAGGRLASMTNAIGNASGASQAVKDQNTRHYVYDLAGRLTLEHYERLKADNSDVAEGIAYSHDALGRVIGQGLYTGSGSSWSAIANADRSATQYNAFGDVAAAGINGLWQQSFEYDKAGRLWKTNSGDGTWKYMGYDKNGNQSVAIASAGYNLADKTFAQAWALISQDTVVATYTRYDGRNMAIASIEEGRQINTSATRYTITTSRSYNGFGEVASETDVLNNTTNYTYNVMGRLVRSESPTVQITNENGGTQYVRPSQDYYYDQSGRLVATRDANGTYIGAGSAGNGVSKAAHTGNYTKLGLLAGTGYDGSQALVTHEYYADGGVKLTGYDIMGDARKLTDQVGRVTNQTFDALGRLSLLEHAGGLDNYYAYDLLGQQIWHYNSQLTSSDKQTTTYDAQGRIIESRAFGGDVVKTSYSWQSALTNNGVTGSVVVGGWNETSVYWTGGVTTGKSMTQITDVFGRVTQKNDLGSHVTNYVYDLAGRQTSATTGSNTVNFTYFNRGQLATNSGPSGTATYGYDLMGRRKSEYLISGSTVLKNATVTEYDALGRMRAWTEAGSASMPVSSLTQEYDANGNIRRTYATFRTLDATGNAATTNTIRDYWFRYDAMNRLVTNRGTLSGAAGAAGTQIVRGAPNLAMLEGSPQDIVYNAAGERVAVISTKTGIQFLPPFYFSQFYYEQREMYNYNSDGRLDRVDISNGTTSATPTVTAAPTTGAVKAVFFYDAMGRVTQQQDYEGNYTPVAYEKKYFYNNKSQLTSTEEYNKRGNDTYKAIATYNYGSGASYALGSALSVTTANYKGTAGSSYLTYQNSSLTTNSYDYWDGAVQASIVYDSDTASSSNPIYTTTFYYNGVGQLSSVYIGDGKPRSVTFTNDENGQVIKRSETRPYNAPSAQTGSPHEIWYRFAGKEMGYTGNNNTDDKDYQTTIHERQAALPSNPGTFRNGSTSSVLAYDFAQSYDPVNSYSQGSASGIYTVRTGDTLASIAQQLYGDSALWYKIAEANGLSAQAQLSEGQTLMLPVGVIRSAHNAATLNPYDPSEVIGDLSPTTPQPPKQSKGCGVFGAIVLAVVAVAVTVVTAGAALAATSASITSLSSGMSTILGTSVFGGSVVSGIGAGTLIGAGAIGGAVGSIARQGLGVATGLQDSFSWKGVALSAIGGGVSAGVGPGGLFGDKALFWIGRNCRSWDVRRLAAP
jgi:YD repeat-containing protein